MNKNYDSWLDFWDTFYWFLCHRITKLPFRKETTTMVLKELLTLSCIIYQTYQADPLGKQHYVLTYFAKPWLFLLLCVWYQFSSTLTIWKPPEPENVDERWIMIMMIVAKKTCSRRAPHPGEDEKAAAQDWRRHRT